MFEEFIGYLYNENLGELAEFDIQNIVDFMQWADFYIVNSSKLENTCNDKIINKLNSLSPIQIQNILIVFYNDFIKKRHAIN